MLGGYIEMMHVEFLEPRSLKRKIIEYERSHPMPADRYCKEKEWVDVSPLFRDGKWRKDVPVRKAMEVLSMLPVGARLVRVEEQNHHVNVEA